MFRGDSIEFEEDMMTGQFDNVNMGSPRILSNVPRGTDLSDPATVASLRNTAPLEFAGAQGSFGQDADVVTRQDLVRMLQDQQLQLTAFLEKNLFKWHTNQQEMITELISSQETASFQRQDDHFSRKNEEFKAEANTQIQAGIVKARDQTESLIVRKISVDHEALQCSVQEKYDDLQRRCFAQHREILAHVQKGNEDCMKRLDDMNKQFTETVSSLTSSLNDLRSTFGRTEEAILTETHQGMKQVTDSMQISLQMTQERIQQDVHQMEQRWGRVLQGDARPPQAAGVYRHTQTRDDTLHSSRIDELEDEEFKELPSRVSKVTIKAEPPVNRRKPRRKPQKKASKQSDSSSSTSSEEDVESEVESEDSVDFGTKNSKRSSGRKHRAKLVTFDGKERWKVWYERFKIGTRGWSDEDRLTEMLQLMKDQAAVFVFDQLPKAALTDYKAFKREMKNRYRRVENPDTYAVMFSNRNQLSNESVQDYAAELTMLYDKAHPHRDAATRRDDLKRRWLDGVRDRKGSRQVEFVKAPANMEEAIDALIKYQGLGSHGSHKASRATQQDCTDDSSDDQSDDEGQNIRFAKPNKGGKHPQQQKQQRNNVPMNQQTFSQQNGSNFAANAPFQNFGMQQPPNFQQNSGSQNSQQYFNNRQPNFSQNRFQQGGQVSWSPGGFNRQFNPSNSGFNQQNGYNQQAGGQQQQMNQQGNYGQQQNQKSGFNQQQGFRRPPVQCFSCHLYGHISRNCPQQMNMAHNGSQSMPGDGLHLNGGKISPPSGTQGMVMFDGVPQQAPPMPIQSPVQSGWSTVTGLDGGNQEAKPTIQQSAPAQPAHSGN